ncbi:MAG TPA: YihY/virulence factor BrkB family protein [Terriglobales bacterium]|nr:YihY/virulence factor BrkB family protein [Terriglobales bacterium]
MIRELERKHLSLVAAGVAYYFVMSLFPALMLLAAVIAYLPMQDAMQGVTSFMGHVIPQQGVSLIEELLTTIKPHRTSLLSFGIVVTLWLSSIGIKGIISGLDIVYDVRVPRRFWINKILAFGLTFAVGTLLLVGVVLTIAGPALEGLLSPAVPVQSLWIKVWPYIQWSLSAIVTFAAIELLYLLAPNVPAARRTTVPGAAIAALSWLALSWGLSFFFHHFVNLSYGALATPIALMVWLQWGASAILMGAEINVTLQSYKRLRASGLGNVLQDKPENISQNIRDAA